MDKFERKAVMFSFELKPEVRVITMDDTFVMCIYGENKLEVFTKHLTKQSSKIKLITTEEEKYQKLVFIDVTVVLRKNNLDEWPKWQQVVTGS